jgi:nicotinate-nucleotide--dimethylbenzimidazole phosphoribosyltransferase
VTETTETGPLSELKAKFPNGVWTTRATTRLQRAAVSGAGLGGLQAAVGWAARVTGTDAPEPFTSPRMLLFAGEYPDGWAAGMDAPLDEQVESVRRGEGLIGGAVARFGGPVEVLETAPSLGVEGPLLTDDELEEWLALGRDAVDRAVDGGADVLLIAGLGAGAATAAVGVCAYVSKDDTTTFLPQLRRPGGLVDDAAWMSRVSALRDHLAFNRDFKRRPEALAARLGGAPIAAMAAAVFAAAAREAPVVLDGSAAAAAMMIARDYGLASPKWCYMPNRGPDPVVAKLAKQAGLADDFGLSLDIPAGAGLAVGWSLLQESLLFASTLPIAEDDD